MKVKLKYFLIIFPVLIGASLYFGVHFSNATCSSEELSQLLKESESCSTINCLINLSSRLETCKAEAQEKTEQAAAKTENIQQKVNELGSSISQKNASVSSLNAQIADLQYKISKLNKEISETEQKMRENKKRIHSAVKNFYEYDQENFVTIILEEKDISNFFDEVFYVGSIEEEISSIVKDLKKDKQSLKKKKEELSQSKLLIEANRDKLSSEMSILAQEKTEQDKLLGSAQANEAIQGELLKKIESEKVEVDQETRRLLQASMRQSTNISIGGTGGYPYAGSCWGVDPWGFYMCQCTSYAAWRWNVSWGYHWTNPLNICGHAKCWPAIGRSLGYSTGSSPRVRAIISWPYLGSYGHVAIVEKVFSDGSINISEYNVEPLTFSRRTISPSQYSTAVFIYPK